MSALPASPALARLERTAVPAAALGLAAALYGWVTNAEQFHRSWLLAYVYWVGLALGCLSLLMVQHLTGGRWGLLIRRPLEAGARTFGLLAVAFLPVALGVKRLYVWAHAEAVAADPILQQKAAYLNVPFFLGRAGFYLAVWLLLGRALGAGSLALDGEGADYRRLSRRLRGLSGAGLLLMGLTITFSATDWTMSLDPHWFSSVYGVLFMVSQALSALSLMVLVVALLGEEPPLQRVVRAEQVHDLGKLLLAFVMLWAYLNLSQFLIVWSGNLPEEVPFYLRRATGGFQVLGLVLAALHFGLPFLLLLSRDLKRNVRLLAGIAGLLLVVRALDLLWLVGPDLQGHAEKTRATLHLHWLDLACFVGLGGLWLRVFSGELRSRPLLSAGEPEMQELLAGAPVR
jgi:hypothetical protein